jgi:hypothetical protein
VTKPRRQVRRTVQIVGEGYAEEYFLKHLRMLYLARQGNVNLRVTNARGKGGRAVLDYALRPQVHAGFDIVAVLVDTDQDWDDDQRQRARAVSITALESDPCLEALLLAIHGHVRVQGTAKCKRAFRKRFGTDAHDPKVYERHFTKEVLDTARSRVLLVDKILKLIGA